MLCCRRITKKNYFCKVNKQEDNNDDAGLKSLFQSLDKSNAPFGLDDRIMKAVESDHKRQHMVRTNLRLALGGVCASFALVALLAFGAENWVDRVLFSVSLDGKGLSGPALIFLFFLGLMFLFIEMELVVKYWLHKHFVKKER